MEVRPKRQRKNESSIERPREILTEIDHVTPQNSNSPRLVISDAYKYPPSKPIHLHNQTIKPNNKGAYSSGEKILFKSSLLLFLFHFQIPLFLLIIDISSHHQESSYHGYLFSSLSKSPNNPAKDTTLTSTKKTQPVTTSTSKKKLNHNQKYNPYPLNGMTRDQLYHTLSKASHLNSPINHSRESPQEIDFKPSGPRNHPIMNKPYHFHHLLPLLL